MKLFNIYRTEPARYDEFEEFVLRAESEEKARQLAVKACGEYRKEFYEKIWLNTERSICKELSIEGCEEIILSSFRAG